MIDKSWNKLKVFASAGVLALSSAVAFVPASAQAQQCADDEGPSKTLNTNVARVLQEVFEQMQNDQYQAALAGLNDLLASRGASMDPFDKATTLELRGSVKVNLEDYRGGMRDFQEALRLNALPSSRNNQLRYFIAQLQFQEQQYQTAISGLNQWIQNARACNESVDANAYYLLAAAYTQLEPPNWRAALSPAESALRANEQSTDEPRKSYYDLLNLVYSELGSESKRMTLLEKMVNLWPGTKSYWVQLSGAYSQAGRDRDAFSVIEVAYRAGLLEKESELLTLIQYYSFFENPYRGAKVLERELAAGNVKRTQKNLVLLSQLWSQAREHKKSIPILREAARGADDGELSYRLGMVLLADEQYAAAQTALEAALRRGGMKTDDTGDAWLLLGTARFSQAGPEDTEIWANAREAFVNAQRYNDARRQATEWITYIDAVVRTYEDGKKLEARQLVERCQEDLRRIEQQQRIRELQSRPASEDQLAYEAKVAEFCAIVIDNNGTLPEGVANYYEQE